MKKKIIIFLVLSLLLAGMVHSSVEVRAPGLPEKFEAPVYRPLYRSNGSPFIVGERLTYAIYWMSIEAGTAVMEVRAQTKYKGLPVYHFVSTAKSSPGLTKIYPVNDRLDSFAAVEGLHSCLYVRHLREGFYKHDSTTTVDHQKGEAVYKGESYPTKAGVKDDLSGVYYFRTLKDLQPGKSIIAEVFAYKKTWEVEAKILGRERVVTPAGIFDTLKVEPILKHQGIFQNLGRVVFWVTDDERRLPVMMQSEVLIGKITAFLREYKL